MGKIQGHKDSCKCIACRDVKEKHFLHLRISEELDEKLSEEVKKTGDTKTDVVTSVLKNHFEKEIKNE